MEIIKRGELAGDAVYTATCNQCGTHIRFQRKEANFVSDQRDGNALVIECPVCCEEIWTSVRRTGGQEDR